MIVLREANKDEAVNYLEDRMLTDLDRLTIDMARKSRKLVERSLVFPTTVGAYIASLLAQLNDVRKQMRFCSSQE